MKRKLEYVLYMFQKEIKSINYLDLNLFGVWRQIFRRQRGGNQK